MKMFSAFGFRVVVFLAFIIVGVPSAFAQTDEIQVYDGGLAPVGTFNLTVHNNFTPSGIETPAFIGAVTSHHSLNGVPEWALGVTNWFEAGLYLPLYSIDTELGAKINGFKLRALFAVPDADDRKFFYGVNFEFSGNSKHWDPRKVTSEVRPIVGWHLKPVDIIYNPIVDTDYTGGFGNLEYVPSLRIAYNLKNSWAMALEHYADYGTLNDCKSFHDQSHQFFAVFDKSGGWVDVEAGVGLGVTAGSDKWQLKLILSKDLN